MKLLSKINDEKIFEQLTHTTNNKAQEDFIIEIYREDEKMKFSNRKIICE